MAEHKVPQGITRVEKGRWSTLDGLHEIRSDDKGWTVERTVDGDGPSVLEGSPFKTRGAAVAKLAELGLLPLEAPKTEAKADKQPVQPEPAKQQEQPKRRPPTRKPVKAAAKV